MEKLVWTSARVNHSSHVAGPAVATPWGHPRAHGERGLSPRLEAAEPAAGCPALNRIIRERMENGLGVGEVWLSKATDDIGGTVWALGPRISPSNSQVTFRSVSDDFESLKVWFIPAACRAGSLIQACGLLSMPPVAAWPPALWGQLAGRDGSLCVIRKLLGPKLRGFFPGWSLREISVLHPLP